MKPFIVMDIVKKASEIEDVIHLEIGEPDLPPSPNVIKAAQNAITNNRFFYTESKGLVDLRKKIAHHYKKMYGVDVNYENIIITTGTSTAFLIAYHFAKKIFTFSPTYPCYANFAELEKKEFLSGNDYRRYEYDTLMISSPNNPTGEVIDVNRLKDICSYCEEKKILLISDELYHGLVYNDNYTTALKFNKNAIVINGFSKYFCMPGFRIGWIIVPDQYVREAEIVAQNILISAPTISQYAALEAFDYEYLFSIREEFKKRRDFLYTELKDVFDISTPDGAFYLWCDISRYSNDSLKFANDLLLKAKVAVTPGVDFGDYKSHIRIAYTKNIDQLKIAAERIKKFIEGS